MAQVETGQTIETMFLEERRYPPPPEFAAQAKAKPDIYTTTLGEPAVVEEIRERSISERDEE